MANEFAIKKLKSVGAIFTSDFKKSKMKKYEDVYRVPIAYVGLLEYTLNKDRGDFDKYYKGKITVDTPVGECVVYSNMFIQGREGGDSSRRSDYETAQQMYGRMVSDPNDVEAQTWYQNYLLREENMSDILSIKVNGGLSYEITTPKGVKGVYEKQSPSFPSVEDYLSWVESESQTAWGEVNIFVSDMQLELQEYNSMESALPSKIEIPTELGTLSLSIGHSYSGYSGEVSGSEDGILVTISVNFVPQDETGSMWRSDIENRSSTPLSYRVKTVGTIIDTNTQLNTGHDIRRDSWERIFDGQGALSMEDAKDIVVSNANEIITEWKDYVASARNYVTEGNGRGRQRTTRNTEDWDYNFGDTWDDVNYEEWQDKEYEERVQSDLRDIVDRDYSWAGPIYLTDGIKVMGDGTFRISGKVSRNVESYDPQELKEYVTDNREDYNKQALDAFVQSLTVSGYEVVSVDAQDITDVQGYGSNATQYPAIKFTIIVRPTLRKSDKMKKSIKASFDRMMKMLKSSKKN